MLLILGSGLTARASLADHYHVPSESMRPAIEVGDRIVVDKRAFGYRLPLTSTWVAEGAGPERGEVVILTSPVDGRTLVKRVIGTPGDTILVEDGRVFLNGLPTSPPPARGLRTVEALGTHRYEIRVDRGGGPDFGPATLAERQYLVMGDNRGNSMDGRSFGPVDKSVILGRALGIYALSEPRWDPL